MSIPSTPPLSDFKFTYPAPCRLSEAQKSSESNRYSQIRPSSPPRLLAALPSLTKHEPNALEQCWSPAAMSIASSSPIIPRDEGCVHLFAPAIPSIPNAPPLVPQAQLPLTSSSQPFDYTPTLDNVHIPSPLLYHKESHELFSLSSDSLEAERLDAALLSCGHNLPTTGVRSHDPCRNLNLKSDNMQYDINPAPLPLTGSDLHQEDAEFRDIPQPPWVLPSAIVTAASTPNNAHALGLPTTDAASTTSSPAVEPCELCAPGLADDIDSANGDQAVEERRHDDISEPKFIEDDPKTIERMWRAFEAVISNSQDPDRFSSWSFSPQSSLRPESSESSQVAFVLPQPAIDIAACPTPACTAVVPARLYRHQYFGWPQWHVQDYRESSFPFVGARMPATTRLETALLVNWCGGLGLEQNHREGCHEATTEVSSDSFGVTTLFEETVDDTKSSTEADDLDAASQTIFPSAVGSLDEDGSSVYEGACEVFHEEATLSDDEWADFDWDQDAMWEGKEAADTTAFGEWDKPLAWEEVHQRLA